MGPVQNLTQQMALSYLQQKQANESIVPIGMVPPNTPGTESGEGTYTAEQKARAAINAQRMNLVQGVDAFPGLTPTVPGQGVEPALLGLVDAASGQINPAKAASYVQTGRSHAYDVYVSTMQNFLGNVEKTASDLAGNSYQQVGYVPNGQGGFNEVLLEMPKQASEQTVAYVPNGQGGFNEVLIEMPKQAAQQQIAYVPDGRGGFDEVVIEANSFFDKAASVATPLAGAALGGLAGGFAGNQYGGSPGSAAGGAIAGAAVGAGIGTVASPHVMAALARSGAAAPIETNATIRMRLAQQIQGAGSMIARHPYATAAAVAGAAALGGAAYQNRAAIGQVIGEQAGALREGYHTGKAIGMDAGQRAYDGAANYTDQMATRGMGMAQAAAQQAHGAVQQFGAQAAHVGNQMKARVVGAVSHLRA